MSGTQQNPNDTMPLRLGDVMMLKRYLIDGGTHAEGMSLAGMLDLRFDNWQQAQVIERMKAAAVPMEDAADAHP